MKRVEAKSNTKIDEVLEKTQIVELISEFVKLVPSGKDFKGLCPFHTEKTPSFTVSPQKNLYYCFGCGAGGNAFNFLMQIENIDFSEALKKLAKRAGVSLSGENKTGKDLYDAMEFACVFYQNCLKSTAGAEVRNYLAKRGLDEEIISRFRLGYSKGGLAAEAKKTGFSVDFLEKAGLLTKNNYGSYYETFNDRLMFPIFDSGGKVLAFGGRHLNGKGPKYLNSRQMEIYDKSSVLYALNLAKKSVIKKPGFILVEGYMDVISLFRAGFENAVASCGTSLTVDQARLLKKYSDAVSVFYDSDESGQKAAVRAIEILLSTGLDVEVIKTDEHKDPDDLVRNSKNPSEDMERGKISWLDFFQNHYFPSSPPEKSKLALRIIEVLNLIPDKILREEWKRKASTSLGVPDIDDYCSKSPKMDTFETVHRGPSKKEHLLLLILSISRRKDAPGNVAKTRINDYLNSKMLNSLNLRTLAEEVEKSGENLPLRKEYFRLQFCEEDEAAESLENLQKNVENLILKENRDSLIREIRIAQQKGEETKDLALQLQKLIREGRK